MSSTDRSPCPPHLVFIQASLFCHTKNKDESMHRLYWHNSLILTCKYLFRSITVNINLCIFACVCVLDGGWGRVCIHDWGAGVAVVSWGVEGWCSETGITLWWQGHVWGPWRLASTHKYPLIPSWTGAGDWLAFWEREGEVRVDVYVIHLMCEGEKQWMNELSY